MKKIGILTITMGKDNIRSYRGEFKRPPVTGDNFVFEYIPVGKPKNKGKVVVNTISSSKFMIKENKWYFTDENSMYILQVL